MTSAANIAIDGYANLRVVGRGGFGLVFGADHIETGERRAIKTLPPRGHRRLRTLQREIRLLATIRHEHVVPILDHGVVGAMPWYAMPLYSGANLRQRLRDERTGGLGAAGATTVAGDTAVVSMMSLPGAATTSVPTQPGAVDAAGARRLGPVLLQVLRALHHVHKCGVVHGDLKPENVLMAHHGAVLADFGLAARIFGEAGREELDGSDGGGTPAYMAPEQHKGAPPDPRSDLYAFGCLLHEVLFGSPRPNQEALAGGAPPHARGWLELTARLLAPDPLERPSSAAAVARDLALVASLPAPEHDGEPMIFRPPLCGRAEQLERLLNWLTADSSVSVATVTSEVGGGKTRFLKELAETLRSRGGCVATVALSEQTRPLGLLAALVREIAGEAWDRFADLADRDLPRLAQLVPELSHLVDERSLLPPILDLARASDAIGAAVERLLLQWAKGRPIVIVVDDGHRLDAHSTAWLASLDPTRIRCALSLGDVLPDSLERLLATVDLQIRLERLDRDTTARVVAGALAAQTLPNDFVDAIYERSDGNPWFVMEFVRLGITRRLLRSSDGGWQGRRLGELTLPARLADVLVERLAGLPIDERDVLDTLALAHPGVSLETLEKAAVPVAHDEMSHSVDAAIASLLARGMVTAHEEGFTVGHERFREVVLGQLDDSARRLRDRQLAAALLDATEPLERMECARHLAADEAWDRAADVLQAVVDDHTQRDHVVLEQAARRLVDLGRAAAAALGRPLWNQDCRVDALKALSMGLGTQGRRTEALDAANAIVEFAKESGRARHRVMGHLRRATIFSGTHRIEELGEELNACEPLLAKLASSEHTLVGEWHGLRGTFDYYQGRYDEARRQFSEALAIFEAAAEPSMRAWAHLCLGLWHGRRTEIAQAQPHFEQSLALRRQTGETLEAGRALLSLSVLYTFEGLNDKAIEALEECVRIHDAAGDAASRVTAVANLGTLSAYVGDIDKARRLVDEAMIQQRALEREAGYSVTLATRASIAVADGELDYAHELLEQARSYLEEVPYRFGDMLVAETRGSLAFARGDVATLHDCFATATAAAAEYGSPFQQMMMALHEATLLLESGAPPDDVEYLIERARPLAAESHIERAALTLAAVETLSAFHRGDHKDARRRYGQFLADLGQRKSLWFLIGSPELTTLLTQHLGKP